MKKVFIDSDIILDLVLQREPFYDYAASIFEHIEKKKIEAYTSPLIFANLFYLLRKEFTNKKARHILKELQFFLALVSIHQDTIDKALHSNFTDFEDAIQYYSAIHANINILLTRNKKDYKTAKIDIYTAEEYLSLNNH